VWVSTDLSTLNLAGRQPNTEDVIRGSKAFRRLSPDFFLWLEKRFATFQAKVGMAGKESEETKAFAERFATVHKLAHEAYTSEDFKAARNRLTNANMESPNQSTGLLDRLSNFDYPEESELPRRRQVTFHALGEVDAIRDQALALGWTDPELYATRGRFTHPCGPGYGVVCFIDRDQRLGKVTDRNIELVCRGGHSLRFYRNEVRA